jgi:recombination protein RecR
MMDPFRRAVVQLSRFPGVGEKTATRYAYWLLRQPPEVAADLADAVTQLRSSIKECPVCCDLSAVTPCARCTDARRDPGVLCVVERPQDVAAIENSGEFRGRFHVLHGAISPLDGIGPSELRIAELQARLAGVHEVILATDPDVEGDATAAYLARIVKAHGSRVTRLAHGISTGTEIEHADRGSLARAIQGRREL